MPQSIFIWRNSMKNKKRGFTLIETLVAIACSSIVFLSMISSLYFLSVMNNKVLLDSSINYNLANLKDTIIENKYFDENKFSIDENSKNLLYDGKIISNGVEIVACNIYEKFDSNNQKFVYCFIRYINSSNIVENMVFIIE